MKSTSLKKIIQQNFAQKLFRQYSLCLDYYYPSSVFMARNLCLMQTRKCRTCNFREVTGINLINFLIIKHNVIGTQVHAIQGMNIHVVFVQTV